MKKHRGFTLLEFLVVAFILIILILIFMPAQGKIKPIALRVVCGTNLKGLGTAMSVYANDYEGHGPQLPGEGPWSKELGFDYDLKDPDFNSVHRNSGRTVSASWYLLVREADVSPKSFICPEQRQESFDGHNSNNLDLDELWDFNSNPYNHFSYAMQNPYGKFPIKNNLPSNFAIAADQSPWFKDGDVVNANSDKILTPQIIDCKDNETWKTGNSLNHTRYTKWLGANMGKNKHGLGQNVLYGDGHCTYEKSPNVGVNRDNTYTYWPTDTDPAEQDIQGGTAPTKRDKQNDSKDEKDSFLVM